VSIEDYDPGAGRVEDFRVAVERVAAAATACARHGIVLTAWAENYLYGRADLPDTIARLRAYQDAGAEVVYAPGLRQLADVTRLVQQVSVPVNVLALHDGPSVAELAGVGVRSVSTGGALAMAAYGALRSAARELLDSGTSGYGARALTAQEIAAAFGSALRWEERGLALRARPTSVCSRCSCSWGASRRPIGWGAGVGERRP